jgi:hypothetical protein
MSVAVEAMLACELPLLLRVRPWVARSEPGWPALLGWLLEPLLGRPLDSVPVAAAMQKGFLQNDMMRRKPTP